MSNTTIAADENSFIVGVGVGAGVAVGATVGAKLGVTTGVTVGIGVTAAVAVTVTTLDIAETAPKLSVAVQVMW
jgi:hypothetical protein